MFPVTDQHGQFSMEDYEVWAVTARRHPHSPPSSPTRPRSRASPPPSPFALSLQVAASPLGALSGSLLLNRVADRSKVQQFEGLLTARLKSSSYRLLYTFTRDGRNAASFRHHCYDQVCSITQGMPPSHCNARGRALLSSSFGPAQATPLEGMPVQLGHVRAGLLPPAASCF